MWVGSVRGDTTSHFLRLVLGLPGLVLFGPLHSEKRVHNRWLPLRVAEVLLLAVLLGPGPSPGWGPQTAGPGQWVQACWEHGLGQHGLGSCVSPEATGLGPCVLPNTVSATHWGPWALRKCECQP